MPLLPTSGASSSPDSEALGGTLLLFGAVADAAAGEPAERGEYAAALSSALGELAQLGEPTCNAMYWSAILRNAGALGNPAFQRTETLNERRAAIAAWDVPADGARMCSRIAGLPPETADLVRWHRESWDGTGFPDRLRWHGIPKAAQLVNAAVTYTAGSDADETFMEILAQGGQRFSPDATRIFTTWFHQTGGERTSLSSPFESLRATERNRHEALELLAGVIDRHTATPERSKRIARLAVHVAAALDFPDESRRMTELAAMLAGIGEIAAPNAGASAFDPLSRLGIASRADGAVAAQNVVARSRMDPQLARVLRATAEWYDGSGLPDGLRHEQIPSPAHVIAVCLAYDALRERSQSLLGSRSHRPIRLLEETAGTQFDPRTVQALARAVEVSP